MYYYNDYSTPVGKYRIVSDGNKLLGIWKHGQKYFCPNISDAKPTDSDMQIHKCTVNWLDEYFDGTKPEISSLPIQLSGSTFRKTILSILCEIPYGEVITYGEIAKQAAKKMNARTMSAQAVGSAVGHNPISIVVPCHRVIGSNGSLVGYAGGIATKLELLKHEGVEVSNLFIPHKGTAL